MSFFNFGSSSKNEENKTTMTITRALVELKTLDKRIQKAIDESVFVSLHGELRKPDERALKAQNYYDKVRDLMERRVRLKSAIVSSNATTQVRVCGMDLTVAEAIELKSSIKNYKSLLSRMRAQYGDAVRTMEHENERARRNLEGSLSRNTSDDKDKDRMNVADYSKQYMTIHGVSLFDPLKIQGKVEDLDKFITEFQDEVDFLLSEKNATTTIEL